MVHAIALTCVCGIAIGQILFKMSATSLQTTGSYFAEPTVWIILTALALYGVTTFVWIWVLQFAHLGRLYPLMALAFVLVPIGSHFIFGEQFSLSYFIGVLLIAAGIFLTVFHSA